MPLNLNRLKLADAKTKIGIGFAVCLLVSISLTFSQVGDRLSRKLLDIQFSFLRSNYPQPVSHDVVLVGIDEATYKSFREPYELWHPHFAKFLGAMNRAKPSVLGIAVPLPEQSYDFLVEQYDQKLVDGLRELSSGSAIVLGQTLDENGNFRSVFPAFIAASGSDSLASVSVCAEQDGVSRRSDPNQCTVNAQGATLAEAMAARLGKRDVERGLVDYSVGEDFNYVPFQRVMEWAERGEQGELARIFSGKPVLLGFVLPFEDRVNLPVTLAAWEPETHHLSAVVWHAQALRSMLNRGMLKELNSYFVLLLSLLATVLWFARLHWYKFVALFVFPVVLVCYSTWLLRQSVYLPAGGILLSGLAAFGLRSLYELFLRAQESQKLRGIFGSYVSAQTLRALIAGNVQSRLEGERKRVCILFAHIHDFEARSGEEPPQELLSILSEYLSEMTAAIHQHEGTVGKFTGDAVMAYFGAPQELECPEKNALEAAQEMLLRVRQVNIRLKEKGIAPIETGVGLHVGEVVIGHVGSEARHEYTAIGEVVNLAVGMADMTQSLGYPVICSKEVADSVELSGGLTELGEQVMADHSVLSVCGWYPPLLAAN